jgi:Ca-activated chloride channel homolog
MLAGSRAGGVVIGAVLLAGLAGIGIAQNVEIPRRPRPPEQREQDPRANIRVDTNLVLIPVTVTDPLGRPVTGLEREHFRVFEEKVEQEIAHFAADDAPLAAGLVFDVSGSMGNKLRKSRQAAAQFFRSSNPEDEFFLVEFNERPQLVAPLTSNHEEIQNRLAFSQSKGRTALLDAVYMALHEMKKSNRARKALLILSDGGDNSSRYTEGEVRSLVRESDSLIYAIGIFEHVSARGRSAEELSGPGLLGRMAEQTGGRHFPVENVNDLPDIAAKIGIELRNRYILGYTSTNQQRDGKYRRVQVRIVQPRGLPSLRAAWRMGYYGPID